MATYSCILAWRILWTEKPGGLQSMGSQRVMDTTEQLTHCGLNLSPLYWRCSVLLLNHQGSRCIVFFIPPPSNPSAGSTGRPIFLQIEPGFPPPLSLFIAPSHQFSQLTAVFFVFCLCPVKWFDPTIA